MNDPQKALVFIRRSADEGAALRRYAAEHGYDAVASFRSIRGGTFDLAAVASQAPAAGATAVLAWRPESLGETTDEIDDAVELLHRAGLTVVFADTGETRTPPRPTWSEN